NKPVDWCWGLSHTTPWYPSAELFDGSLVHAIDYRLEALAAKDNPITFEGLSEIDIDRDTHYPKSLPTRRPSLIATNRCRYGSMSFHRNDTYIGRALDLYGEYSESEVDLFRRILKTGDTIIEAGANIGALTVPLAQIVGPSGWLMAFEPQPASFQLLDKNTK